MIKISITQTDKGNKTVDESAADRSEAPKPCCLQQVGICNGRTCFVGPGRERAVTTCCHSGTIKVHYCLISILLFQTTGSSRHFAPVLFFIGSSLFLPASEIICVIVLIRGHFLCYIYSTFGGGIFSRNATSAICSSELPPGSSEYRRNILIILEKPLDIFHMLHYYKNASCISCDPL